MGALSTYGAFSVETILAATVWLEEKHCKTPRERIAMAIALHYLILALRHHAGAGSAIAEEYCVRAARWQAKAGESGARARAAKATEQN
jgi:hypothetical protein